MGDGNDYRKNLITVPACDDHNLEKSHDDEYLHLIVIHGYFNNPLAQKQFKTKLTRAFSRRPALLAVFHLEVRMISCAFVSERPRSLPIARE